MSCRAAAIVTYKLDEIEARHLRLVDLLDVSPSITVNGYFGHLYKDAGLFYVADASGLHYIDKNGKILWSNLGLAIDGVIVNEFTDRKILGSGELDPPGGWKDFALDKPTGIAAT